MHRAVESGDPLPPSLRIWAEGESTTGGTRYIVSRILVGLRVNGQLPNRQLVNGRAGRGTYREISSFTDVNFTGVSRGLALKLEATFLPYY